MTPYSTYVTFLLKYYKVDLSRHGYRYEYYDGLTPDQAFLEELQIVSYVRAEIRYLRGDNHWWSHDR